MVLAFEAEIAHGGLVDRGPNVGEVRGDVVFKAFAADVLEQRLQLGNLNHARAAKGLERIVGEMAFLDGNARSASAEALMDAELVEAKKLVASERGATSKTVPASSLSAKASIRIRAFWPGSIL